MPYGPRPVDCAPRPHLPQVASSGVRIGRIAAGIWAAIAFFGALATIEPLRFPETDVSATRLVVLSATAIAAVTIFAALGPGAQAAVQTCCWS